MIGIRLVHFETESKFDDTGEKLHHSEWWQKRFIISISVPWGKKYLHRPSIKESKHHTSLQNSVKTMARP